MKDLIVKNTKSYISNSAVNTSVILVSAFSLAGIMAASFVYYLWDIIEVSVRIGALLFFIFCLLISILSLIDVCHSKTIRINSLNYHRKNANSIEYIKFTHSNIEVHFTNPMINKIIPYSDIKSMKIVIRNLTGYPRCDIIKLYTIKIIYTLDNTEKKIALTDNETFGMMDRLFNIIYFSKYIHNFSYNFTETSDRIKVFDKALKSFINNNYKHTFNSFGFTKWAIPVQIIVIISLFVGLFLIGYLIVIGVIPVY